MTPAPANLTASPAWFPLINRPRPPARPLPTRVAELRSLATADNGEPIVRSAEALNKAALIASDCGRADLAKALCWRQYDIFDQARPLPPTVGELALQPILNLPRQLIRDGNPGAAHRLLVDLHHAVHNRADITIDGHTVHLRDLTGTNDDLQTLRTLIWTALLADGTRALTAAGRWSEAARHADAHRGVGQRLLDGRQTTILALLHDGHPGQAADMVEASVIASPWELAVQAVLRVLCQRTHTGSADTSSITTMFTNTERLISDTGPGSAVFTVRTALTALELGDDDTRCGPLLAQVLAVATTDAYAAKDAHSHPSVLATATASERQQLTNVARAAGLAAGQIPQALAVEFAASVALATDALNRALRT